DHTLPVNTEDLFVCNKRLLLSSERLSRLGKEPGQQRVKRWGFGIKEVLKDPLSLSSKEPGQQRVKSKEPGQQRVKRWGFGINEVLKDPVGREQFLKFLESEFSSENLRFWLAVQEVKKRPIREVPTRVQEIWQEFLAPGAPSAINVDSKSYDKTTQNVKDPGRYAFEDAQEHIYKLMKSDSYSRFLRSNFYQELLQAKKKKSKNLF
ncbi:regulator of G-protein signaling 7, partial [Salmo salar]|uniref:Regulator of G-protein signaling 7 n=1 Tax=Salmo salar TaxID=8030 RepID=A0A1S3QLU1_SALSA